MAKWTLHLIAIWTLLGAWPAGAQIPRPKPFYPQSSIQSKQAPPESPVLPAGAVEVRPASATLMVESMEQIDDKRKLVVGDQLSLRIPQDRDNKTYPLKVTDMGEIQFPLIGRVKAVNKTMKQLAYEVKNLLDREYYYNATVLIGLDESSKFRGRIYVIGQVPQVGPQDIPSDEVLTVSKAILRAGGFGDFADQRKVKLIRKGWAAEAAPPPEGKKDEVIVDVKAVFKGEPVVDPVVQPDDMIVVPARAFNF